MTLDQICHALGFSNDREARQWILARCKRAAGTWVGGQDLEDLAQEVWMMLCTRPAGLNITRAFVCRMLNNRYADWVRHHRIVLRDEARVFAELYDAATAECDRQGQDLAGELSDLLALLSDLLPPMEMKAFMLKLEGRSLLEISRVITRPDGTTISQATACRLCKRAEAALRALAGQPDPDPDPEPDPPNGRRPPRDPSTPASAPKASPSTAPKQGRTSRGQLASLLLRRLDMGLDGLQRREQRRAA